MYSEHREQKENQMKRMIGGVCALIFLCGNAQAQAEDPMSLLKMQREMLCTIVHVTHSEGAGAGTKIYHPSDENGGLYVLTNAHVVREFLVGSPTKMNGKRVKGKDAAPKKKKAGPKATDLKVKIFTYGPFVDQITSRQYPAMIAGWSTVSDLALLFVPGSFSADTCVVHLAARGIRPRLPARSWAVGTPQKYEPVLTEGRFANTDPDAPANDPRLVSTAPIALGNSGGALFHFSFEKNRYEMVGVPTTIVPDDNDQLIAHLSLSIMSDTIHDFLAESGFGFIVDWHAIRE